MSGEDENYGTKIAYDPLWKGPMNVNRSVTDFKFLKFFGIFILIWLGVGIYAMSVGDLKNITPNHGLNRARRSLNSWTGQPDDHGSDVSYNKFVKALKASMTKLVMCTIFSASLAIAYIILLRWFAKTIVWTVIILFCLSILMTIVVVLGSSTTNGRSGNQDNSGGMILAIFLGIILGVVVILVVLSRKKINIACEIIREGAKAVMCFPSLFAVPVPIFILNTMVLTYWAVVLINLSTIRTNDDGTPIHVSFFYFYNFFGLIWLWNFVQGIGQMITCGSFATWYWTYNKNNVPQNAVAHSAGNTGRYHLGTVALGAMIITICSIINYILESIKNRLKQGSILCCCFGPCLYYVYKQIFGNLERFVRYMNTNALIMSSVHGTDFCESAKQAFNLIMRNVVKTYITTKVTNGVIILGQILVILISGLITWGLVDKSDTNEMNIAAIIVAWVVIFAAIISSCFFRVLENSVDTVFLCALEDYERNDGSQERPYYMSQELRMIMLSDEQGF